MVEHIGNKQVRSTRFRELKRKEDRRKKAERKKRQAAAEKAEKAGAEPVPKPVPKTIENTRELDETIVAPDDEEVAAEETQDEFADHFKRVRPPHVLITTCFKPSGIMYKFIAELLEVFPNATYYKRQGFPLKKIVQFAKNRDFSDVVVINEDRKMINGMLVTHLPEGPTAQFRLSNLKLSTEISNHGRISSHRPEVVLNNFSTRLGHRVGRLFASLFHQDPAFRGRRVVTFHNQRDFIFFRHHRYIFEEKADRRTKEARVQARLQELGPRFTLQLESLQKGTFDSKSGEFEWLNSGEQDTSRRRFKL
ncbi:hypothetical protein ACKKBG_A17470 [Auxenochlorella protothecoides x Auxenochlorella symbiontica]|nr:Ribosome production factor 1 [Auxenochlorella protothecoides]KFM24424.1 Ribosome production factor 1 [Auxenochlorella protothecoides]RMZ54394.1 hypothetical protein APUTEX25_001970 [Auxenochlorella protothecoides]|eukprot:RMZ54394.1 hypothetical protein APUTEX25_001970 [Auxenochlorella protothecoides]